MAGGLGINLLSGMIERVANGEGLSDDDIIDSVNYALKDTKIADALTEADFRQAFMDFTGGLTLRLLQDSIQAGQQDIALRLIEQMNALNMMELRLSNQLSSEFAAVHRRLDALKQSSTAAGQAGLPEQPRHIRIFISSPGDVADERNVALKVIDDLAHDPFVKRFVTLEALAWENARVPMYANFTPQKAVNEGMALPAECDIVIVMFWSRMGTPLPAEYVKPDGSRYLSGTEWEYWNALEQYERTKSLPKVLVYRRTAKVALDPDDPQFESKLEQYQRVKDFFAAFYAPDGSILRGMNTHNTPAEFGKKLEDDPRRAIERILKENRYSRKWSFRKIRPPCRPATGATSGPVRRFRGCGHLRRKKFSFSSDGAKKPMNWYKKCAKTASSPPWVHPAVARVRWWARD